MPWKECNLMNERVKFIARLLDGENMSAVCREFGISRKTGYKIFNRYKECGLEGLKNQVTSTDRRNTLSLNEKMECSNGIQNPD